MRLAKALQLMRLAENKDTITMAREIGIPKSTLNRIELGKPCDVRSMARLVVYLFDPGPRKERKTA